MRRILALPQNDTHAETLRCLVPELVRRDVAVQALDLDGVYHQGLDLSGIEGLHVAVVEHRTAAPFYRSTPLTQLRTVRSLAAAIRRQVADADVVLAFNDGALQRVALHEGRRRGQRTALLIDGMLSTYQHDASSFRRMLRRAGRALNGTSLGALLPSEIGMSPVDSVFVVGPHSAEVLRSRGAPAAEVIATGLPRFPEEEPVLPRHPSRLLYLTGAYGWHGADHLDAAQVADVRMLGDLATEMGLELTVRVHPRDDVASYQAIGHEVLKAAGRPLGEQMREADVVLALASTGLLEAIALGRVALTLSINPPWQVFARSFAADPFLGSVRSVAGLRNALSSLDGDGYVAQLTRQRAAYRRYACPGGPVATRAIAEHLAA